MSAMALTSSSSCLMARSPRVPRQQCFRAAPVPAAGAACSSSRRCVVVHAAAEEQQAASAVPKPAAPAVTYMDDSDFSISKVSFGSILTPIGLTLLGYGFGAYFTLLPGGDVAALLLVYGFPISLLGFALSYAQLEPVTCKTTKEALELRATQMTDNQKQIREDCTRFRYGDEQHLEEALNRIFKPNRPGGVARKLIPVLTGLRELVVDGRYSLVLEFVGPLEWDKWEPFQAKFESFFGPGITATLAKTDAGVDVFLTSDGSGSGRGGEAKKDVLPPLMPGLKARQQ